MTLNLRMGKLHRPLSFAVACLLATLELACQRTDPTTGPNLKVLQSEAEKLKKEHHRETHNR